MSEEKKPEDVTEKKYTPKARDIEPQENGGEAQNLRDAYRLR